MNIVLDSIYAHGDLTQCVECTLNVTYRQSDAFEAVILRIKLCQHFRVGRLDSHIS